MSPRTNPHPYSRLAPNIVLIGLSGSGKSTVAQHLARCLGWKPIDLDSQIENAERAPITEIFARRGEAEFRRIESESIATAMNGEHQVIATGGGAILLDENRERLWARGFVVYLRSSAETLVSRLTEQGSDERPLLRGDLQQRLASLLESRCRYYEEAHAVIDTDGMSPADLAERIVGAYGQSH
ncbi:MAG: shikimate kinase [Chloroflexota bacterium]